MQEQVMVESVPNFSEGRNPAIINDIIAAADGIYQVEVLHVDSGYDANRTVVTLAGEPHAVVEAIIEMTKRAIELIDLRQQRGVHARMGALDVCPLIPLQGINMQETAQIAQEMGARMAQELQLPIYLYEAAAQKKDRSNLALIRKGQFEALAKKMQEDSWRPDFGPRTPHPSAGATVVGARPFLVAYNINLNTRDEKLAQLIAGELRESGRIINGQRVAGKCTGVKAIGWLMPEYDCAQVSTNIVDLSQTKVHEAHEACRALATKYGLRLNGAELIGMIPLSSLLDAGRFYLGNPAEEDQDRLIEAAVEGLGLNTIRSFEAEQRILELRLNKFFKSSPDSGIR